MKKLLLSSALAAGLIVALPVQSRAYWNSPQCSEGNGFLGSCALRFCPKIHMNGPLYNYGPGPYSGPGYQDQFVPNGLRNGYVPSDPNSYMGIPGNRATQWQSINPAFNNQASSFGSPGGGYYQGQPMPSYQQPYAQGYGMPMQQTYTQGYGMPMQQPYAQGYGTPAMQQQPNYSYPSGPTVNQPVYGSTNAPAPIFDNADAATVPQSSSTQTTSSSRSLRSRLFR
jgi:hypothetical protein